MRVHGEFQPHLSPGGGRADRHGSDRLRSGRKMEDLLRKSWFGNDARRRVLAVTADYSHGHEGSSDEDAGSFHSLLNCHDWFK